MHVGLLALRWVSCTLWARGLCGLFGNTSSSLWLPEGSEGSEGITKVLVVLVAFAFWSGGGHYFAFMPGVASIDRYIFVAHRLVSVPCL
ncbi:hypothetical protein QBC34DRAFT_392530, partial [Podospora aff. communis PSN243]